MQIIDNNNLVNNINNNDIDSINNSKNNISNQIHNKNNNEGSKLNMNESNFNSCSNYSEKKSNGINMVSHDSRSGNYYIKTKRNFNNININNKINYFQNKINYINFIHLLNLFITKNTQEHIFYILLNYYENNYSIPYKKYFNIYNNYNFTFPFYISTLGRLFRYIKKENKYNKRLKYFLDLIFPSLNKNKSFYYLLICLTFENRKKLINTNLYNINKEKNILIQFLDDFSNFDKNISNKEFITEKINKTIFYNTNIFTLVKFIDNEYDKLSKGIYCNKCYQNEKNCNCIKKEYISNYSSNGSDDFDLDLNGDTESKSGKIKVNYFIDENDENNSLRNSINNSKIIFIRKKPKYNDNLNDGNITLMLNQK